jgi:hypothetical protein
MNFSKVLAFPPKVIFWGLRVSFEVGVAEGFGVTKGFTNGVETFVPFFHTRFLPDFTHL